MLSVFFFAALALAQVEPTEPTQDSLDTCLSLCGSGVTDSATVALCTLDCLILPQQIISKWHSFPLLNISTELRECARTCFEGEISEDTKFSCMSSCWEEANQTETRRRLSGGGHGFGGYGGYGAYRPYYGGYYRPYHAYRPYVQPYHYSGYRTPYYGYQGFNRPALYRRGPLQVETAKEEVFFNVSSICLKYCDTEIPSMIADELNLTVEERTNISSFFDLEEQGLCLTSCVFSLLDDSTANYSTNEEYEPMTVQCLSGCMTVQDEVVEERMAEYFDQRPADVDMEEIDLEDIDVEICFMQCLDSNATLADNETDTGLDSNATLADNETDTTSDESTGRRRLSGGGHGVGGFGRVGSYRPYRPYYGGYRGYYSPYGSYRPYVRPYARPYISPYYSAYRPGAYDDSGAHGSWGL